MQGKHSKKRGPLGLSRGATGALVGLAVVGVAATTVHASAGSSGPDGAEKAAAVATIPAEKRPDARKPSGDARDEQDERSEVIARAKTWRPHTDRRVPYSQSDYHDGYRTDCSGYVAMALDLPKPGPNTVGLTSSRYTKRIKMSELKKGDLVMDAEGTNTTRHVVIFEKWADDEHTSYWAFEQRGRYGTDHRTRDYGLDSGSEYKAYRPKKL
ncbi:hypothetical protein [Spirillospora sp. NPDC029432]|uniref:hypothetical protein n=1 Tax=Spirillospora sp. NPDC029432 TaxID=3154599 RepID=UPI00345658E5